MNRCRKCEVELQVGTNWSPSVAKLRRFICKGCVNAAGAIWRNNNREKCRECARSWAKRNSQRVLANHQKWSATNVSRCLANQRRWRSENPERVAAWNATRRARQLGAFSPDANPEAIAAIYALAKRMTERFGVAYHVDHLVPLSKGGLHHQDNLVVMRGDLNLAKNDKIIPELIDFFS